MAGSAAPGDIVYPIAECPEGPHDTPVLMATNPQGQIGLVMCPTHQNILNLHTGMTFKEWLTESELLERGFVRLA